MHVQSDLQSRVQLSLCIWLGGMVCCQFLYCVSLEGNAPMQVAEYGVLLCIWLGMEGNAPMHGGIKRPALQSMGWHTIGTPASQYWRVC